MGSENEVGTERVWKGFPEGCCRAVPIPVGTTLEHTLSRASQSCTALYANPISRLGILTERRSLAKMKRLKKGAFSFTQVRRELSAVCSEVQIVCNVNANVLTKPSAPQVLTSNIHLPFESKRRRQFAFVLKFRLSVSSS
ncbi:hypothetical protein DPEC_G00286510 [Dallia pectoralis]|uniref:Uncharacterized protein n=1 Tax=Dallia pectoralis TaxID=75939 RepID=A0ACC2FK05_DALPE|nr:hypothetical protein DPEC_G00286510 [Dallia pectoralis]